MAFIRRTLSPVPRLGTLLNREPCEVSSPLSKSSNNHNYPLLSSMGSFDYALYKVQCFILGIISAQSFRPLEKSKVKGQIWRRAFLHFFICFVVGIFVGLTTFVSTNLSIMSSELLQPVVNNQDFVRDANETLPEVVDIEKLSFNESSMSKQHGISDDGDDGFSEVVDIEKLSFNESLMSKQHRISDDDDDVLTNLGGNKLLIIVTPTYARERQIYYLTRLANTLKLVPSPFLWIVVEMKSQSPEIAELLRKLGVMSRHLVCRESSTDMKDKRVHLMNVALSHIEKHHMDGIVYFADDDNVYSVDLFNQMRQIRRFGTWVVAKLGEREVHTALEGPICNGSQVEGWHVNDMIEGFQRFHAEMSGFAFNSTILWDPKTWDRPTREPIRHLDTVEEDFQASSFIEQVVEDESQMECFPSNSNEIMVWHRDEDLYIYPQIRVVEDGLSIIIPLP